MSENILKTAIQTDTNIWVNASAGSGKTYVLIRRILKLLLNKTNPNKILCITFTNAATFEMKQRLQNILYNWQNADVQTVKKDLLEIDESSEKSIKIARKLFNKHASNPVQIETIHGFCNKILLQFPLESKTNPFFSIMDESTDDLIKKEAIHLCLKNNKTAKILQLIPEYIFDDLIDYLIENIDFISSDYQKSDSKIKKKIIFESEKIYKLGKSIKDKYEKIKTSYNYLSYNDIIKRSIDLLGDPEYASWVMYKMDGLFDHLLIDEAQDTSKKQWALFLCIIEGFLYEKNKTIFVVGDFKQSIYGFQGADPYYFLYIQNHIRNNFKNQNRKWTDITAKKSYRSDNAILKFVDKILDTKHESDPINKHGSVYVHNITEDDKNDLKQKRKKITEDLWDLQTESKNTGKTKKEKLAEKIANMILNSISKNNELSENDFMILMQRRSDFVNIIIEKLLEKKLKVAGVDRLPLYNSTVVMDIVAILKFVSNPFDDLNLSVVLKGPLWSFSDQDIYKLAINKNIYMIREIKEKSPEIYQILMEIVSHGNDMHAFDFINYILHNLDLYDLFLKESYKNKEIIEEFMEFAYENDTNIRSFLKFFMETSPIMKKSTESQEGVKIMTIHNAKGLESKIVIMADTTICMLEDMVPAKRKPYTIDNDLFYYFKNHESDYFKAKVNEDLDLKRIEQDRLLYVGMTRAKFELHIMGYKSIQYKKSWHHMIMEKIKNDNDFKLQNNIYVLKDQKDSKSHTKTKKQKHKEAIIERKYEKATNTKTNIINKKIETSTSKKTGFINERGLLIHKKLEITDIKKDSYANKMLANKNINWIFKHKSYAEVPVMIEKENKEYRIDRMVIEGDTLHIIDYKTDRSPPTSPIRIPKQYISQMQNYMELFIDEYKIVRCYILWTSNNNLMEIDMKKTNIAI